MVKVKKADPVFTKIPKYVKGHIEILVCYLYNYRMISGLEHLPIELQRNFTLMRDLDARAQTLMRNIDRLADEYLRNVKTLSPDKKKEQMSNIQSLFNKAKEYGDDKVQLAIQTYELVRRNRGCGCRLDSFR